jgi:AcrR family transcriptional regulator
MSPRQAPPELRDRLVDVAARVLAEEGPSALSARRVASEAATSTMAVYTQFGGMDQLRAAVRMQAFGRLHERLEAVGRSEDPVADLLALGLAYCAHAVADPQLYRAMLLEAPLGVDDAAAGWGAFQVLVDAVQRCVDERRFRQADAWTLATEIWVAAHGLASLQLAGLLTSEVVDQSFRDMATHLLEGFGDDRDAIARSLTRVRSVP